MSVESWPLFVGIGCSPMVLPCLFCVAGWLAGWCHCSRRCCCRRRRCCRGFVVGVAIVIDVDVVAVVADATAAGTFGTAVVGVVVAIILVLALVSLGGVAVVALPLPFVVGRHWCRPLFIVRRRSCAIWRDDGPGRCWHWCTLRRGIVVVGGVVG